MVPGSIADTQLKKIVGSFLRLVLRFSGLFIPRILGEGHIFVQISHQFQLELIFRSPEDVDILGHTEKPSSLSSCSIC